MCTLHQERLHKWFTSCFSLKAEEETQTEKHLACDGRLWGMVFNANQLLLTENSNICMKIWQKVVFWLRFVDAEWIRQGWKVPSQIVKLCYCHSRKSQWALKCSTNIHVILNPQLLGSVIAWKWDIFFLFNVHYTTLGSDFAQWLADRHCNECWFVMIYFSTPHCSVSLNGYCSTLWCLERGPKVPHFFFHITFFIVHSIRNKATIKFTMFTTVLSETLWKMQFFHSKDITADIYLFP